MSLLDTLRSGIALANSLTKPLQAKVGQEVSAGQTRDGKHTYPSKVMQDAIVEFAQKTIRTASGQIALSRASVLFLDPAIIVRYTDRLTLPDGSTGPILDISGFADAKTGRPMLTQVYLG